MHAALSEKGIRLSVEAELLMDGSGRQGELESELLGLGKLFVTKEDVEQFLSRPEACAPAAPSPETVEVRRTGGPVPLAKEHGADIRVVHTRDVTGKSRTKGEVEDFVGYFRNRYDKLSGMLRTHISKHPTVDIRDIKRSLNDRARIIVLVKGKRETKKGNVCLEVEDKTGEFQVIVSSNSRDGEKLADKAKHVLLDDMIAVSGKVMEHYMIAEDIEWPDMPLRQEKLAENDLAVAYLSDLHFGSRYFLDKYLKAFVEWLHCRGEASEIAGKVKYLIIAGDVVDGIGIYPNQERELVVKDIYAQYRMFDDFVESLPDYVEVIVAPGNHDAVRRGEPMPAISKEMIKSDVTSVGNPSTVVVEGLRHLVYHATSIDSMIANLPDASYMHPEKVMVEYLKRRHLSPIYGGNLIIPESVDYMVIEDEPDVLHGGHVHRNGHAKYRGTLVINSGTFQDRTDFQVKQGHVPTPAVVPVYEMKRGKLRLLDFKSS